MTEKTVRKYAVIGLGRFGSTLARQLGEYGAEVIAIDRDEARVSLVRDHVSVALCMDGTDERRLREQGVDKVDVAVVGMGESFEATQLTTVVLKRLGVGRVVVKSVDPLHEKIVLRLGADEVVSPEKDSARRLAQVLVSPRVVDYLELSEGFSLVQLSAPEKFCGKSLSELDVRRVYGVNIVAIKKRKEVSGGAGPGAVGSAAAGRSNSPPEGSADPGQPVYEERLLAVPRPTDLIEAGDVLVVIGADADISRLAN
jgi:trk system potassium uptake protein TrkA